LLSLDAFPENLPLQVSSFVGRERELARVVKALDDARVVTLTGVGGVGKTRLALQVDHRSLARSYRVVSAVTAEPPGRRGSPPK
jgi:MoxR-like ATPase